MALRYLRHGRAEPALCNKARALLQTTAGYEYSGKYGDRRLDRKFTKKMFADFQTRRSSGVDEL